VAIRPRKRSAPSSDPRCQRSNGSEEARPQGEA
jgi:hypothetical protein